MVKRGPKINLREAWEDDEEEVVSEPESELDKVESAPDLEEVQQVEEDVDIDERDRANPEPDEPQQEPEQPRAEEVKKKDDQLVRHIIPIDPELAERMWGRPLTPEQRQRLEEDWALGFRQLTDEERRFCGISNNPETYARMENLSKNYLKVSLQQGKEDLIVLELAAKQYGWPEGYLRDENGRFTDRCVFELMQLRRRVREWILPEEPDGSISLEKYKRGDLAAKRGIRVKNPRYNQRFDYQDALFERARRWRAWKEERDRAVPTVVEVGEAVFGELVLTPQARSQHEAQRSVALQKLEEAEQLLCSVPEQLKDSIWETVRPLWANVGLELRANGIAYATQIMQTGEIDHEHESTESDQQPNEQSDRESY